MRVLTICEHGINRSVAARWLLQHQGHEVIPVGLNRHSESTLSMLYAWADRVVLLDARLRGRLPVEIGAQLTLWDVGPDSLYPHHLNPDLVARLRAFPTLS